MSLPKLDFPRVDVPLPAQNPADLTAAIERLQEEAVVARSIETSLTVEVERLRAVVADQQMLLDEHRMDNQHAYDEGVAQGIKEERARVVTFLRAGACDASPTAEAALLDCADAIDKEPTP